MSEIRSIVQLWQQSRLHAETAAGADTATDAASFLVTLVRVEGSSYRKPGARLLSCASESTGSISGGCLEGEVLRKAAWLTQSGAVVQRYSTLFDDTSEIPYGLGCGGVVDLLLEPLHLPETQALLSALALSLAGERMAVITLLPALAEEGRSANPMQRMILRADGSLLFASQNLNPAARAMLVEHVQKNLSQPTQISEASLMLDSATRNAFLESIAPPQRLFIFGAGNDAQPLASMAHLLGWRVIVVDGRSLLARAERFPDAEAVRILPQSKSQYAEALASLGIEPSDAAVLLTHSYEQDRTLLPHLLTIGLRYLGLLGARHRSRLLLIETAAQLGWTPEQCLAALHTPVGLPLGGDTPEAVALAIVAEIQSVLHGCDVQKNATERAGLLNEPAMPYVPTACPLEIEEQSPQQKAPALHD